MKKLIFIILILSTMLGCTQRDKVNHNITQQADNFNIQREVTAINGITGEILFQISGRLSIISDTMDGQLEIIVENEEGKFRKHFIGLSDNVTYVVEDKGEINIDKYGYEINFNPKFLKMFKAEIID